MAAQKTEPRQLMNRLKTAAGHIRGVQRMVESDAYCIDIIGQTQAVRRALDKVNSLVLAAHLNGEVTSTLRDGLQPERERVITDLLTIFRGGTGDTPDLPAPSDPAERTTQRLDWLKQLEARVTDIQHMLESSNSPITVMSETQTVQRMLDVFQSRVLADHLNGCVTTAIRSQQPAERERVVNELLQVFTSGGTL